MDNITPILSQIATLGATFGAQKIVLFGSRARGDHHQRSDIDLAVYGLPTANKGQFAFQLEELPTLLKFDVVLVDDHTDAALVAQIKTDGVTIYETDET
ncbi:nucleotidyltransferase domain-containing protein [Bengtsoniella intestinalis]|uniref:nucleotidyltransferase domain-containing protein n=1 Tax=Bengtsoniella intestinalis TaxID=3073143 RepID=UPI00391F98C6